MNTQPTLNYMAPDLPANLNIYDIPLVKGTSESLKGYGTLVDDYKNYPIEIVPWPVKGKRPLDPGTGNEGGTTAGIFDFWWEGDFFYGKNNAVNDEYLLGWSKLPQEASTVSKEPHDQVLLWHANYHPDGGQLFYPLDQTPFVVPLALPEDDLRPAHFKAFYFDGSQGLYIHPNVWHEGIFPLADKARFYDEQGKVHARVSSNLAEEFGILLRVELRE